MKDLKVAIKLVLFFAVLTGVLFPIVVWCGAQAFFPDQANGSIISDGDREIGSALIGQRFVSEKYFSSRPSAAGLGYDPLTSGGTNLGPTSAKLINGVNDDPSTAADESFKGVADLSVEYRKFNRLPQGVSLPSDAVTRSGSGLDPEISVQNALFQARRVSEKRGIGVGVVNELIKNNIESRFLGIWGEPRVNVLKLNLKLDKITVGH